MYLDVWYAARAEHAQRLRADGVTLQVIGDRLGVTRERARQLVGEVPGQRVARGWPPRKEEWSVARRGRCFRRTPFSGLIRLRDYVSIFD